MRKEWMTMVCLLVPVFGIGLGVLFLFLDILPISPLLSLLIWDLVLFTVLIIRIRKLFTIRQMLLDIQKAYQCSPVSLCRILFALSEKKDSAVAGMNVYACAELLFPIDVVLKAVCLEAKKK